MSVYDANKSLNTGKSATSAAPSCNPLAIGQPAGSDAGELAELNALAAILPPPALGELLTLARALAADAVRSAEVSQ